LCSIPSPSTPPPGGWDNMGLVYRNYQVVSSGFNLRGHLYFALEYAL
jgi:hypothetical protein